MKLLMSSGTKEENCYFTLLRTKAMLASMSSCYELSSIRFSVAKTQPLTAAKLSPSLQWHVHNFFALGRHLSYAFTALILVPFQH